MKKRWILLCIFGLNALLISSGFCGLEEFDFRGSLVSTEDFISKGPSKDEIPTLFNPQFLHIDRVGFLADGDLVVGLYHGQVAKAYPLNILNWHEVVNDQLADQMIVVTWSPLTRSVLVFDRNVGGQVLTFGVSGLFYHNGLVLYDRQTNSLWPQLSIGAVSGQFVGQKLKEIPCLLTTWGLWKESYPETLVLSTTTGYACNYLMDPYALYQSTSTSKFPLNFKDERLAEKELVVGVKKGDTSKAYPLSLLAPDQILEDELNGETIKIIRGPGQITHILSEEDNLLPSVVLYWFAWRAFHPDTQIYEKR